MPIMSTAIECCQVATHQSWSPVICSSPCRLRALLQVPKLRCVVLQPTLCCPAQLVELTTAACQTRRPADARLQSGMSPVGCWCHCWCLCSCCCCCTAVVQRRMDVQARCDPCTPESRAATCRSVLPSARRAVTATCRARRPATARPAPAAAAGWAPGPGAAHRRRQGSPCWPITAGPRRRQRRWRRCQTAGA